MKWGNTQLPEPRKSHDTAYCMAGAGDVFTPAEKGVTQRALDQLMGWRVLGQRHKERILPVGATITAIGELAVSSADIAACKGTISIGQPHSFLVLQVHLPCSSCSRERAEQLP